MKAEDPFSVAGQVVVVTGAARGNGRAIAEGFLARGARVVFADVSSDVAAAAGRRARALAVVCDVTDEAAVERLVKAALEWGRRIDTLVNNAGVSLAPADPYDTRAWDLTLAINLTAPFKLCRLVAGSMARRGAGSIINVTSLGAERGFPRNPSYQAAKAGLAQLTRAMALDFGPSGVRVNNLCPGYIRTDMTKNSYADPKLRRQRAERTLLKRWGESADLVGPCLFLASKAASYITGSDLVVDGGWLAQGL